MTKEITYSNILSAIGKDTVLFQFFWFKRIYQFDQWPKAIGQKLKYMTKLITAVALATLLVASPVGVSAEYGQEVLGESTPEVVIEHAPVNTGIADSPAGVASILLGTAAVLYVVSKKGKSLSVTS